MIQDDYRRYEFVKFGLLLFVVIVLIFVTKHYYEKFIVNDNVIDDFEEVRVVSKFDDYSYFLDSDLTLYKKYYRDLKNILTQDNILENEYVICIARLFIIDFYTLSDKITNQDIGGVQFIHSNYQDKFIEAAKLTFYKNLQNNLYGDRNQEVPIVTDIIINDLNNTMYNYEDIVVDNNAYNLKCTVKFENGNEKIIQLKIVHEGIRLSIVEIVEN